ncbi:MAG: hypothetical protein ACTHOH_02390 [Lysobacteraceae bacterium]
MKDFQVVQEIEKRVLPRLHEAKDALEREFPSLRFNVWSFAVGGATPYQGHKVVLGCIFPDAADHVADNVAIVIGVKRLTTGPLLCEASVDWGHGCHPDISVELLPHPVAYSTAALNAILARLDELVGCFRSAVLEGPG